MLFLLHSFLKIHNRPAIAASYAYKISVLVMTEYNLHETYLQAQCDNLNLKYFLNRCLGLLRYDVWFSLVSCHPLTWAHFIN